MLADSHVAVPVEPDYKFNARCMQRRMRRMHVSCLHMAIVLRDINDALSLAPVVPWLNKFCEPASRRVQVTGGTVTRLGTMCGLPACLGAPPPPLFGSRPNVSIQVIHSLLQGLR